MKKNSVLKSWALLIVGAMALVNASVASDMPDNLLSKDSPTQSLGEDKDYEHVPVRRLIVYIEDGLMRGLSWTIYQSDAEALRQEIVFDASRFLNPLYTMGALVGDSPSQAYRVTCDASPEDIKNGRLQVIVKVAPVKADEFVTIRLTLQLQLPE